MRQRMVGVKNAMNTLNVLKTFSKKKFFSKHAIATSSCTGALQLGLAALNIGKGDEIILADTNWIATAQPIVKLGATPIFVDILPDTWCIDPVQVKNSITEKTKAIVATHLYGNLCDMDRLMQIGDEYKVPIIEDAAEAIGSSINGKAAGSMGHFGVFSFHGTKTMTTGEGGMLITNDDELSEQVRMLNNHGRAKNQQKQFWADTLGYKFKMSNLQAAVGFAQLQRLEELVAKKKSILKIYKQKFSHISSITMNYEAEGIVNGAWMPTVVFDPRLNITRDSILERFSDRNIDARAFFWPLSSQPMFTPVKTNYNSWSIPERAINLPSFHDITDEELEIIAETVLSAF